ncbi:hypothetical protein [Caproicibacterium sp. BJN0003]|uniref:hypothetical protein n=1 Tax=Caproicibacterium sp. BJN0003 TaxID=2994078 RepID=UPI002258DFB5|nr:hypothetical protein [Caproicibacterium sp. BJN0003]UZT81698.1 hypothetical protein OP489_09420 [Caproicibacterium sp. BJN0003]
MNEKTTQLLRKALSNIDFFSDQNGNRHGIVTEGKKCTIIDISHNQISCWLRRLFLSTKDGVCSNSEIDLITNYIESLAADDSVEARPYFTRIGADDLALYYDLGNKGHDIVTISKDGGIKLIKNDKFDICFKKVHPQVTPNLEVKPTQLFSLLKPFFHLKNETDFLLLLVYLVSCFLYDINHPILILYGEAGSSKSSTIEAIGEIVDPHGAANRLTMNPDRKSMVATLSNRYFLGYDNLDCALKKWQSDLLCSASTGGSEPMRVLYTNNTLQEVNLKGCVCLNGLTIVATEKDLLDRSILIEMKKIPTEEYLPESDLKQKFENILPDVLGAIFNTLHIAMQFHVDLQPLAHGRMQDFAQWGFCIAQALGEKGEKFSKLYATNTQCAQKESKLPLIQDCLTSLMCDQHEWSGSMTKLRDALWTVAKSKSYKLSEFPANASVLSRQLGTNRQALEGQGISYVQHIGGDRHIIIKNENVQEGLCFA